MAPAVAPPTTGLQLGNDRSARLPVGRHMVVLEEVRRSAVDADPVALAHDPTLSDGRVAASP